MISPGERCDDDGRGIAPGKILRIRSTQSRRPSLEGICPVYVEWGYGRMGMRIGRTKNNSTAMRIQNDRIEEWD